MGSFSWRMATLPETSGTPARSGIRFRLPVWRHKPQDVIYTPPEPKVSPIPPRARGWTGLNASHICLDFVPPPRVQMDIEPLVHLGLQVVRLFQTHVDGPYPPTRLVRHFHVMSTSTLRGPRRESEPYDVEAVSSPCTRMDRSQTTCSVLHRSSTHLACADKSTDDVRKRPEYFTARVRIDRFATLDPISYALAPRGADGPFFFAPHGGEYRHPPCARIDQPHDTACTPTTATPPQAWLNRATSMSSSPHTSAQAGLRVDAAATRHRARVRMFLAARTTTTVGVTAPRTFGRTDAVNVATHDVDVPVWPWSELRAASSHRVDTTGPLPLGLTCCITCAAWPIAPPADVAPPSHDTRRGAWRVSQGCEPQTSLPWRTGHGRSTPTSSCEAKPAFGSRPPPPRARLSS